MLIILFAGIIIFLSDKSRPNRVRTEGNGANWGMRCGDRALHLGLCPRQDRRWLPAAGQKPAAGTDKQDGICVIIFLLLLFQLF